MTEYSRKEYFKGVLGKTCRYPFSLILWFLTDMHARGRTHAHPTLCPLTCFLLCAFPVLCPEHPSHSSLNLNPTGPAKSHISPLLKSQFRARSSLESLQYFHLAKLSPLSSSDLTRKTPLILSSSCVILRLFLGSVNSACRL